MNSERPLILISNDDGYKARGINFLADLLAPMADVLVMAPDGFLYCDFKIARHSH